MKPTTFGDSQAAITLAKILDQRDDRNLRRSVSSFWGNYNRGIKEIRAIKNVPIRRSLMIAWRETAVNRIARFSDTEIVTYLRNIVVAKFREHRL